MTFVYKMEKDQTAPISTRISLDTFSEIAQEIQATGKNRSDWLREAIEEKLVNDNKEKLEMEIRIEEEKLNALKRRRDNFVEKEKIIQKIPAGEVSFFLETKKVIENDPNFIKGRISLYKNKFNKNHLRISVQEFLEMVDKAYTQYQEKLTMKDLENKEKSS